MEKVEAENMGVLTINCRKSYNAKILLKTCKDIIENKFPAVLLSPCNYLTESYWFNKDEETFISSLNSNKP